VKYVIEFTGSCSDVATTGWIPSGYSNKKDKVKRISEHYRAKHNQRKNKQASKSRRRNRR
jgi:hypothetical protein